MQHFLTNRNVIHIHADRPAACQQDVPKLDPAQPSAVPQLKVVQAQDQIQKIIITCSCGEIIEIQPKPELSPHCDRFDPHSNN